MDMGKNSVSLGRRVRTNVIAIAVLLSAMTVLVLLSVTHTFAADTNTANTLKVSPVRTDVESPSRYKQDGRRRSRTLRTHPSLCAQSKTTSWLATSAVHRRLYSTQTSMRRLIASRRFMTPLKDVTIPAKQSEDDQRRRHRTERRPDGRVLRSYPFRTC